MSRYVPWHAESTAWARAATAGVEDAAEKYRIVTEYVDKAFVYDYIRAVEVPKRGGLPDVDRCWRQRMGICLDLASMTVGMLRAVGIRAYLCIGWCGKSWHAWVEADVKGQHKRYDHRSRYTGTYKTMRRY